MYSPSIPSVLSVLSIRVLNFAIIFTISVHLIVATFAAFVILIVLVFLFASITYEATYSASILTHTCLCEVIAFFSVGCIVDDRIGRYVW